MTQTFSDKMIQTLGSIFLFLFFFFRGILSYAQVYLHPTTGMGGEYVGACMVNTCSGTYYDDGGPSGNYSNGVNQIYRTFCPNAPGMCVRVSFTMIDFHNSNCIPGNVPCDFLNIINGATQNDPIIDQLNWTDDGTTPTYTGTSANGCLTFRFYSNSTNNAPGWAATISCVPCAANTSGNTNTDCATATAICSNASFSGSSIGPGISSDGCSGCNTSEHYTNWYYFCASTAGVLQFSIDPTPNNQDYDFALYGPNVTCGSLGTPIRCSYYGGNGSTGLQPGAGDFSESAGSGNGWVETVNVNAGDCFYLMVNKWSNGGTGFNLSFAGSTTTLSCSVLPTELIHFSAEPLGERNEIRWSTASEKNNHYFTIEKSFDGRSYQFASHIPSLAENGNSTHPLEYIWKDDQEIDKEIIYYQLKQTDYDGNTKVIGTTVVRRKQEGETFNLYPNPAVDYLNIEINSERYDKASVLFYDLTGKPVKEEEWVLYPGLNKGVFSVNELPEGVYMINIKGQFFIQNRRFFFIGKQEKKQ